VQATFDEERTQMKGQLLDLRSELDKARYQFGDGDGDGGGGGGDGYFGGDEYQ
jgi:hypothetical protein